MTYKKRGIYRENAGGMPFLCPECGGVMVWAVRNDYSGREGHWYCKAAIGQVLKGGIMPKGDPHKRGVYAWLDTELIVLGAKRMSAADFAALRQHIDDQLFQCEERLRTKPHKQRGYWR